MNTTVAFQSHILYPVKANACIDLYAVIREGEKSVSCMGCFSCAFASGSYFRVSFL